MLLGQVPLSISSWCSGQDDYQMILMCPVWTGYRVTKVSGIVWGIQCDFHIYIKTSPCLGSAANENACFDRVNLEVADHSNLHPTANENITFVQAAMKILMIRKQTWPLWIAFLLPKQIFSKMFRTKRYKQ